MHNFSMAGMARAGGRIHFLHRIAVLPALMALLAQAGCLFHSHRAPSTARAPALPVRIAFLPLNVPQGNADLRWIAVAAAVMGADMALAAPDLEPAPLWESMPAAIQSLGDSRAVTAEIAELTAARLSARWLAGGEVRKAGNMVTIRLDFIPSRSSLLPFRYEKPILADKMGAHIKDAFGQFLRFLMAGKLQQDKGHPMDSRKLKSIADAVDAEYGWYSPARKPGGAGAVVEDLVRSDPALARLLFSPTLYPVLAK